MEAVTGPFSNPRRYEVGTDDYVEATAERARKTPNVVESFIAAMTAEGWVVRQIATWINERLGREPADGGYSRLREWARGGREVPQEVVDLIAPKATEWVLREVGFGGGRLPEEVLRKLVERAYPWAAAVNQPGRKPTKLSAADVEFVVRGILPPEMPPAEKKARPKRAPKATAKKKTVKKVAAKKAPVKRARKSAAH